MVQSANHANHAGLLTSLPTVEEVLDDHASVLGHDLTGYRNHVYRVVNLCLTIAGDSRVEVEKIAVAAVFHDLGIWTNNTFDYIAPSVTLAREHLAAQGMADWIPEIEAMIMDHHKVTPSRANPHPSTVARGALSGVEGQSLVEIISAGRLDRRHARVAKVRPPAHVHRGCRRHVAERGL